MPGGRGNMAASDLTSSSQVKAGFRDRNIRPGIYTATNGQKVTWQPGHDIPREFFETTSGSGKLSPLFAELADSGRFDAFSK